LRRTEQATIPIQSGQTWIITQQIPPPSKRFLPLKILHVPYGSQLVGGCHISAVLADHGFSVRSTDIVDRGSVLQDEVLDFLKTRPENLRDIITNPPYKFAAEFVKQALDISCAYVKVAMFLKLTFLESEKRKQLFDRYPPERIYVFRNRVDCWKNGVKPEKPSKAVCYAWFVWVKGFDGSPEIHWI
jgi:hypothetical protein